MKHYTKPFPIYPLFVEQTPDRIITTIDVEVYVDEDGDEMLTAESLEKIERVQRDYIMGDIKRFFVTKAVRFINGLLGKYGQNAYCLKRDVKILVQELGLRYSSNPVMRQRFQELLDDIEDLTI